MNEKMWIPELFGYVQDRAIQNDLSVDHLIVLNWFTRFVNTGNMKTITIRGDTIPQINYYWVSYKKVLSDLPIFKSIRKITLLFNELCGNNKDPNHPYPLYKHIEKTVTGTLIYFAVNQLGYAYLTGEDLKGQIGMEGLFEVTESMVGRHTKGKKKTDLITDLSPRIRETITAILQDGSPFHHKINDEGNPTSKVLLSIEKKIKAIHSGMFTLEYSLDARWQRRIDLSILDEMKGDLQLIEDRIIDSAQKLIDAKKENPELIVTKSLDTFLYNPRSEKSSFISYLTRNHTQNEYGAASIKKQLPERCVTELELIKIERPAWNSYMYWKAMLTVYDYLKTNWVKLVDKNKWGYSDPSKVLKNYGAFLLRRTAADPHYMSFGGFHWDEFCEDFYTTMGHNLIDVK